MEEKPCRICKEYNPHSGKLHSAKFCFDNPDRDTLENYDAAHIFNVDETGLFFACYLEKRIFTGTLTKRAIRVTAQMSAKDRLTAIVCTNAVGDKVPIVCIGKATLRDCYINRILKKMKMTIKNVTYERKNKFTPVNLEYYFNWIRNYKELDRRDWFLSTKPVSLASVSIRSRVVGADSPPPLVHQV